jgi:hypothetical protein
MTDRMTAPDACVVAAAMEQVLRVMYFCESVYRGGSSVEAPVLSTSLTFEGAVHGTFRVMVSERCARQMTADFLVLESEDVSSDQIEATVREFANVICGATLNLWIPEATLRFSVPADLARVDEPQSSGHCFSVSEDRTEIAIDALLR